VIGANASTGTPTAVPVKPSAATPTTVSVMPLATTVCPTTFEAPLKWLSQ
jgi:hypothetical protein